MSVCVVGLGRIGEATLRELLPHFPTARGVEVNEGRLAALAAAGLPVHREPVPWPDVDTWIIATSTGPGLLHLTRALAGLPLRPGQLVAVESTVPVGTMHRLADQLRVQGLTAGQDVFLVHAPHRIMFGRDRSVFAMPRVVGGVTPACLERGSAFYRPLVSELVAVDDVRLAELCKLAENAIRFLDIAFAEELALFCRSEGLDFQSLRRAVNSRGDVALPSVDYGIGGDCLPKDAAFLAEATRSGLLYAAAHTDFRYRARLAEAAARGRRILVRGITYKPGVRDLTGSRAVELVRQLEGMGRTVEVEDPLYTPEELAALGFTPAQPGGTWDVVV
ncbi:MAG: nucleotide sugar dehydrogenase, partial [Clostridia bacterium]|nr:nucleotide sugar dehydrogenase [Clostridia bacterium]